MPKRKSFLNCRVLLTHWDPDMYPEEPLPLIPELTLYLLAYGEVWLKEVDLFQNEKIAEYLLTPAGFQQFSSLISTKRVKVLIPYRSRNLYDPNMHPILSTALEIVESGRPFRSEPWIMNDKHKRLCDQLDHLLVANGGLSKNGVVRHRAEPPIGKNDFAATLIDVLTCADKRWHDRPQFRGIDERIEEDFIRFAANHEIAIDVLRGAGIVPNATNGFYRSLLYQCADCLYPGPKLEPVRQAIKNLGQSVYAHCELDRERAMGVYAGNRIAELPPTTNSETSEDALYRVAAIPTGKGFSIPVAPNIGEIVSAVLEDCDEPMRQFWAMAGESLDARSSFYVEWERIAQSFAEHTVGLTAGHLSQSAKHLWDAGELIVHTAQLVNETGTQYGFKFAFDLSSHPWLAAATLTLSGIATYGKTMMEGIRRGIVAHKKAEIAGALIDTMTARSGPVGALSDRDDDSHQES